MNQQWYFPPNMVINRSMGMMPTTNGNMRKMGLFQRFGNLIHSVNWKNLLTNTNKTLNVINQTIPLIRQTGPMVNNMRSMLRLAKAFRKETTTSNKHYKQVNTMVNRKNTISNNDSDYPVFFI